MARSSYNSIKVSAFPYSRRKNRFYDISGADFADDLYCDLTDKTLHDGYIEYTLLYDMIANRITIDEVRAENGCLRLMKNLVWEKSCLGI